MKPDHFADLLAWLAADREVRSLKIDVRADDPEYVDEIPGIQDPDVIQNYGFSIEATDVHVWGLDDDPLNEMTSMTHHGQGCDFDEAAEHVLAAIVANQYPIGGAL